MRKQYLFAAGAIFLALMAAVCIPQENGVNKTTAKATFGAGCFWGVEAVFHQVKGVTDTAVGYMGGTLKNPTYEQVCSHRTGHIEVCQVTYDPSRISYEKLVEIFFNLHNPTQRDQKGPDIGVQYRSAIFFHNAAQERVAHEVKERLEASGKYQTPISTAIVPASEFWRAEEYHQRYFEKSGMPSCQLPIE